ncbi:cupin domain-containing protein, partial [Bacillus cereus]
YQYHNMRSETWTIIKGRGVFILDGKLSEVTVGDILKIPPKAKHAIKAISDLEFIEVQIGSKLIEEDITRISILWSEIEKHCCLLDL